MATFFAPSSDTTPAFRLRVPRGGSITDWLMWLFVVGACGVLTVSLGATVLRSTGAASVTSGPQTAELRFENPVVTPTTADVATKPTTHATPPPVVTVSPTAQATVAAAKATTPVTAAAPVRRVVTVTPTTQAPAVHTVVTIAPATPTTVPKQAPTGGGLIDLGTTTRQHRP